jgi:hypothetical protein
VNEDQQKLEVQGWGRLTGNIILEPAFKGALQKQCPFSLVCKIKNCIPKKHYESHTKVETYNTHLEASEAVHPHRQHTYHPGLDWKLLAV